MESAYIAARRPALHRQRSIAHYMLLGTVIATVVNIIFLLAQAEIFIPYCAAGPYYLMFMGFLFDNYVVSTYTITAMILAFVGLAVYLLVWWMAKRSDGWLWAGMILLIADTAVLLLFAIVFLENPGSCIFEVILHIAVIYEICVGLKSSKQLQQLMQPEHAFSPGQADQEETPAESEYSDIL